VTESKRSLTEATRLALLAGALVVVVKESDENLAIAEVMPAAEAIAGVAGVTILSVNDDATDGALIELATGKGVLILLDYLSVYGENPRSIRYVREVALQARGDDEAYSQLILIERPAVKIPPALESDVEVVVSALPDTAELLSELEAHLDANGDDVAGNGEARYALASAGAGLARHEFARLLSRCQVEVGTLDPTWLRREKAERVAVKLAGALTFESTDSPDVGGLDNLRGWLDEARGAFASAKAKAFGLDEPKGLLIVGVPGGGKSLTARSVARQWGLPLLRCDFGKVFSKYVGGSEAGLRAATEAAEAASPCVLWIDEIEKGLAGSGGGGGDSGTSQRVFGSFLTWLQEKTKPVFVVATANSIKDLPPELLRKGRFDDIFFVGLPQPLEREAIARIHLTRKERDLGPDAPQAIATATEGFTGAEIEQAVHSGLRRAFAQGRDLLLEDVLTAAKETAPLSKTAGEDIKALEAWAASGRARYASAKEEPKEETTRKPGRAVPRRRAARKGAN